MAGLLGTGLAGNEPICLSLFPKNWVPICGVRQKGHFERLFCSPLVSCEMSFACLLNEANISPVPNN